MLCGSCHWGMAIQYLWGKFEKEKKITHACTHTAWCFPSQPQCIWLRLEWKGFLCYAIIQGLPKSASYIKQWLTRCTWKTSKQRLKVSTFFHCCILHIKSPTCTTKMATWDESDPKYISKIFFSFCLIPLPTFGMQRSLVSCCWEQIRNLSSQQAQDASIINVFLQPPLSALSP